MYSSVGQFLTYFLRNEFGFCHFEYKIITTYIIEYKIIMQS